MFKCLNRCISEDIVVIPDTKIVCMCSSESSLHGYSLEITLNSVGMGNDIGRVDCLIHIQIVFPLTSLRMI